MLRHLFALIILFDLSYARENPFFFAEGTKALPVSSNKTKSIEPLRRAAITLPASARVIKKVTIDYQNLDGSIAKKTISLDRSVDWHLPIFVSQTFTTDEKPEKKRHTLSGKEFSLIADMDVVRYYQSGNTLRIETADKLIRHFMVIKPHRIVMDFKREMELSTRSKKLKGKPFTKIRMGNHDGYYRVVIELDGQYHYKIEAEANAQLLTCY